jgi:hypothetical protein
MQITGYPASERTVSVYSKIVEVKIISDDE